ncbi:hypothetical protein ACFPA1_00065 [Neobacillus sp. GCM10023253]|uniref:hypothetical protein n=1 Tax=Neobacillus sp. GCM10023253 TaxID=3252644 RepID=UPI003608D79B
MKTSSKIIFTLLFLILLASGFTYLQIKNDIDKMRIDNCIKTHQETWFISMEEIVKQCKTGELK